MTAIDAERAMRLDRAFDDMLRRKTEDGSREAIDAEMVATLRDLCALGSHPVPDPAFVQRLGEELAGSEAAPPHRVSPPPRTVILRNEGSRPMDKTASNKPRFFAGAQNDTVDALNNTQVVHGALPLPPLNGHRQLVSDAPPCHTWWQRWEIAALLVIAALGGYLLLANLGRAVLPLSRLSAITVQTEGTAPAGLRTGAIGIDAPIEAVQAFPDDMATHWAGDIWATGWKDGKPVLIPEPSAPFTVAWLEDSAAPGEDGNTVLYGHLEYWDPGHAVFWNLKELIPGDQIDVVGKNDEVFTYTVEWSRRFPIDVDEEQQREILGPTDQEGLTLITNAGAYDRETGAYPEVLVVRALLVGSAPLVMQAIPDPDECLTARQSVDAIEAVATVIAMPGKAPTQTPLHELTGLPADIATTEAVIAAESELVACLNANDPLRVYSLYTADGLARLVQDIAPPVDGLYEWAPDFSGLAAPVTPIPTAARHALLSVDEVRVLPDGRVAALVTIGPGGSTMAGVPTGVPVVHVLVSDGGRYLIDEFSVPPLMGTPTP